MMPPTGRGKGIDLNSAMMDDLTMNVNVRQEVVVTTVDKLKLCLLEHRDHLLAGREWVAMLGLTLSLVATLAAATFTDKWLPAAIWEALFMWAALGSAAYTLILVIRAVRGAMAGGIDGLITRIAKRNSKETPLELSFDGSNAEYEQLIRSYLSQPPKGGPG